jgi:Mrp family chromosome partitioning ATPase
MEQQLRGTVVIEAARHKRLYRVMMDDWSRTAEQIMLSALESKIRTLAVTSVSNGAGVSTVANGLAIAFSRSGRKTLLVDLTEPVRDGDVAVRWSPGEPLPQDAVAHGSGTLAILSVVPTAANRALFGNVDVLQKVFQRDLAAYSNIVIDLPAVDDENAARLNPLAAARAADAVIMVALTGLVRRAELEAAAQKLKQVGANLTGLILNDQYCATLGEEIADVTYNRLGRIFPKLAHRLAQKALASAYLNRDFKIVR